MKKHIILLLTLLCQMLGVAAEDKVYISDFSIKAGETKRIELCFDTDRSDITRLQGTVTMPEGLTVVNQSSTAGLSTWMTGNSNRTGGATVTYNPANGSVLMTIGQFTAGTGAVGYIDVTASSSLADNSTITISDFKVMNNKKEYTDVTSENCTVTREASGQGGGQSGEATFAFSQESITLDKGQTTSVDVTMTNSVALTGMQATLTASDGLTITGVTKSSRIVGQFRYNTESGLLMHFGSINGNEGTLFTLHMTVAPEIADGIYNLNLCNVVLADVAAGTYYAPDTFAPIEVKSYIKGDANGDDVVNVGDYVTTANYILEMNPDPFIFEAADVDENNAIDVGDLVGIVNIVLGDFSMPAYMHNSGEVTLSGSSKVDGDNHVVVTLNLSNHVDLTAWQMNLALPNGMTLVGANLTSRASGHSLAVNELEDGSLRLLGSSAINNVVAGNEGALLTLELDGVVPTDAAITVSDVLMAEADMTTHAVAPFRVGVVSSAVKEIAGDVRIYADGGNIVVETPVETPVEIIMVNGMSRTVTAKAGINIYPASKGINIVRAASQVVKLNI